MSIAKYPINKVQTTSQDSIGKDIRMLESIAYHSDEVSSALLNIVVKLNGSTIRSALGLQSSDTITLEHIIQWSKL